MNILSTKSIPHELIDYVITLGHHIVCQEFIDIQSLDFELTENQKQADLIIFTSANAVKTFLMKNNVHEIIKNKKIASLAGKTKIELEKTSIEIHLFANHAQELGDLIIANKHPQNTLTVLHPTSNLSLDTLEDMLHGAKIRYEKIYTYETALKPKCIPPEKYDTVMFFSPSGIKSFLMENKLLDSKTYCCIGETTSEYLKKNAEGINVITASFPSAKHMIETILKN